MHAMILAAGRGERMRPLSDHTPKPLLKVGAKALIVWHLERLAAAGFRTVVINHAHLGQQIESTLGDGRLFGLDILYSPESPAALETAGGIAQALPLLGTQPFLLINADIWCDWDCAQALRYQHKTMHDDAHLVFVDNPAEHPAGDFSLIEQRVYLLKPNNEQENLASAKRRDSLTYAGIGMFKPTFFHSVTPGQAMKLRPLLDAAIVQKRVSGEHYRGLWLDIGTPERLDAANRQLAQSSNSIAPQ
ncbi:MAG: nucleotidyltransferase family protein [Pseudomonadota bacterium]